MNSTGKDAGGMLEPISEDLRVCLQEWGLCTAGEIHRATRRVRELARDFPAFDSVWIDALVGARLLTPFQAAQLDRTGRGSGATAVATASADGLAGDSSALSLRQGPFTLIDALGQRPASRTYLAFEWTGGRVSRSRTLCIKRLAAEPRTVEGVSLSGTAFPHLTNEPVDWGAWLERTLQVKSPSVVLANRVLEGPDAALLVSRYVAGMTLSELLVRRGRVAPDVVWQIGLQLVAGLNAMHARECVHGDITLSNIRLTAEGNVVLVDGGLAPLLRPRWSQSAEQTLEQMQTVAPELVAGEGYTSSTDLYSLGCVLWHLLAGRPPFISADRITLAMSHRRKSIADVREWAPETPAGLADAIERMTRRDPAERPVSAGELLAAWGPQGWSGKRKVSQFRRSFDSSLPHLAGAERAQLRVWPWAAAVLLVATGLVGWGYQQGLSAQLAFIGNRAISAVGGNGGVGGHGAGAGGQVGQPFGTLVQTAVLDRNDLQEGQSPRPANEWPLPSAEGVIELTSVGPYRAVKLSQVGPLTIKAAAGVCPRIEIRDTPLRISAENVRLENLQFHFAGHSGAAGAAGAASACVVVQSQGVVAENCVWQLGRNGAAETAHGDGAAGAGEESLPGGNLGATAGALVGPSGPTAIAWKSVDDRDAEGGQLRLRNCRIEGNGPGVYCGSPVRLVDLANTLKLGSGNVVTLGRFNLRRPLSYVIDQSTFRETGALLRVAGDLVERVGAGAIEITAKNSVFAVGAGGRGLVELMGDDLRSDWPTAVHMQADDTLVANGTALVAHFDPSANETLILNEDQVPFEGLLRTDCQFAGPRSGTLADQALRGFSGPRRGSALPGIQTEKFSGCWD